jgi:hypothetical protein
MYTIIKIGNELAHSMYVHVGIGTVWAIVNGSFPGFNEYAYE